MKPYWRCSQLAQALAVVLAIQGVATAVAGGSESASRDVPPSDATTGEDSNKETWTVHVSPECAAVVILGSGAVSGVASWALVQAALPVISSSWCGASGFCAAGVKGGSLASWWQSTMPLVAKGHIFATLQSIAMSTTARAGVTAGSVAIGSYLGGATGAGYLRDICALVDEAAAEGTSTHRGTAVLSIHQLVKAAIRAGSFVYEKAGDAVEYVTPHVEHAAEYVKENLPHAMRAAEAGLAGAWGFLKDTYKSAQHFAQEVAEKVEQKRLERRAREAFADHYAVEAEYQAEQKRQAMRAELERKRQAMRAEFEQKRQAKKAQEALFADEL